MLTSKPYTPDVIKLHTAELIESHRLLDSVGIPQSGFNEQLTISQRVAEAVQVIKNLRHPMSVEGTRIGLG